VRPGHKTGGLVTEGEGCSRGAGREGWAHVGRGGLQAWIRWGAMGTGGEQEMQTLGTGGEGWKQERRAPAIDLRDAMEGRDWTR
jgi:hypothetical protein